MWYSRISVDRTARGNLDIEQKGAEENNTEKSHVARQFSA